MLPSLSAADDEPHQVQPRCAGVCGESLPLGWAQDDAQQLEGEGEVVVVGYDPCLALAYTWAGIFPSVRHAFEGLRDKHSQ